MMRHCCSVLFLTIFISTALVPMRKLHHSLELQNRSVRGRPDIVLEGVDMGTFLRCHEDEFSLPPAFFTSRRCIFAPIRIVIRNSLFAIFDGKFGTDWKVVRSTEGLRREPAELIARQASMKLYDMLLMHELSLSNECSEDGEELSCGLCQLVEKDFVTFPGDCIGVKATSWRPLKPDFACACECNSEIVERDQLPADLDRQNPLADGAGDVLITGDSMEAFLMGHGECLFLKTFLYHDSCKFLFGRPMRIVVRQGRYAIVYEQIERGF